MLWSFDAEANIFRALDLLQFTWIKIFSYSRMKQLSSLRVHLWSTEIEEYK